ncbi:activating signal cointegrator 1 complex subunit 3 [Ceratobasidium sp. AG-Ba]|nr:activating signal cointegrator 1 complex subunit 3 [Ceratobasidium sp. AG-Ba]
MESRRDVIPSYETRQKAQVGGEPLADEEQAANPNPTSFKWREPNPIGENLGRDSQIWEIYVEETDRSDKELVKEWNDSLDVLLIFVSAALFSAITTALVIESSHQLQPDPSESSAQTLLDISRTLVAISNGQPVDQSSLVDSSSSEFSPSRTSVAVNALWFLSLGLSVAVSLLAMLSKSWCIAFMSKRTGPKYEQGRRRQLKWAGIERWGMQSVFVYLPALMHMALLLFAIGLAIYLWDTNKSIACPVIALVVVSASVYTAATLLPLIYDDCPYSTPLSKPLKYALNVTKEKIVPVVSANTPGFITHLVGRLKMGLWKAYCVFRLNRPDLEVGPNYLDHSKPTRDVEYDGQLAQNQPDDIPMDSVTSYMLVWLIENCEDQRLVNITLQTLAGACRGLPRTPLVEHHVVEQIIRNIDGCFAHDPNVGIPELKSSSSVSAVLLYARALSWILASDAEYGFWFDGWAVLSSRRTEAFTRPKSNEALANFYKKFINVFFYAGFAMGHPDPKTNPDIIAAFISMVAPATHHYDRLAVTFGSKPSGEFIVNDWYDMKGLVTGSLERVVCQTLKLKAEALLALLEAVPHCMIGDLSFPIIKLDENICGCAMSLVQLIWSPSCASIEHRHAIGLALTVFAILSHPYPGWKRQLNDPSEFHARAAEVYGYHKTHRYEHSKSLVVFGLLGLLRLEDSRFTKNDMNVIGEALKRFGSIAHLRTGVHTLPNTFHLGQMAIEYTSNCILQALVQPLEADTFSAKVLLDLSTAVSISKYWSDRLKLQSNALNAVTSTHSRHFYIEALGVYLYNRAIEVKDIQKAFGEHPDPTLIDELVSLSLGEHDVYAAPAAMYIIWEWIRPVKVDDDSDQENIGAASLELLLNAEALPDELRDRLASQPRGQWLCVFADMWYPLLEEMSRWDTTERALDEVRILDEISRDLDVISGWEEKIDRLRQKSADIGRIQLQPAQTTRFAKTRQNLGPVLQPVSKRAAVARATLPDRRCNGCSWL